MWNDEDRQEDRDNETAILGALASSIYTKKQIPPKGGKLLFFSHTKNP
jgi:hypothetical protein